MTTKQPTEHNRKTISVLHLVTPQSQGQPLCGETSPAATIGAYCEHLGESGEWCREVFGKGGKAGKSCEPCLALYPSLLWGRPQRLNDSLNLQAVLQVSPYPQSIREEFNIQGFCLSDDFRIEPEPLITGQRVIHGKVALTIMARITPKPPGKRQSERRTHEPAKR